MVQYIQRETYLRQLTDRRDNGEIKIVTGPRRSGKSWLLSRIYKDYLLQQGVAESSIIIVSFDMDDEEETGNLTERQALKDYLYSRIIDDETPYYVILDEVQEVEGFERIVNGLNARDNVDVYVTGSNSHFLSSDIKTIFRGRGDEVRVYPFSFRDFCTAKNVDATTLTTKNEAFRRDAFDQYLKQGGFPELLHRKNKTGYVNTLVENILKRDIEQRHKIKYSRAFEQLAQHLLNIAPATIVSKDLANLLKIKSSHTVDNYINYLMEAYLLVELRRYSTKSKNRLYDKKVYPIDVALMDGREDAFSGENLGFRLESLVYIELLRRNRPLEQDIYYYKNSNGYEADFVVCKGNKVIEVYQVSYDISSEKTFNREVRGLLTTSRETRCDKLFLITDFQRDTLLKEGKTIKIIPAYEWMLGERED